VKGPGPPYVALIDGDCGLCRATEAWVRKRDKHGHFEFHTLQSVEGARWLERVGLPVETRDTMVLIEGERGFVRSTAVLRMTKRLRAPWPLLYAFVAVPRPLRDAVYRLVARNRRFIRVPGRPASCALPTHDRRDR
jgi:predicted DCC family thiol-disulfide oxidoreductase YuxK